MQANWLWGFDQFINDITMNREENMKTDWENSTVSTMYMYQRVHGILQQGEDMDYHLSRLMDELAYNYRVDVGHNIGEDL